jgi:hypothetical protein
MSQFPPQALNWLLKVLEERFGHEFTLVHELQGLKLLLRGSEQGRIIFPKLESAFHESRSDYPCAQWDANSEGWQSVLSKPLPMPCVDEITYPLIENKQDLAIIHYDILGLTYWMLNRIEEIGRTDLDNHQRFPAINSHAYKHGYLDRPVVDEWLNILGQVIQKQWPQAGLKQHQFSMKVSHDVDSPSLYQFKSWKATLRMMVGHLLKRCDIKAFVSAPVKSFKVKLNAGKGLHLEDPHNTFDWIMDMSDANNLTSAFYFICGRTSNMDADYEPDDYAIRELMRRINNRGHEIGLHPSYSTYQQPELIRQESNRLRQIMHEENISQSQIGGRMHYLRWQHPATLQAWHDSGMSYDTTLGYADLPGFRCGTCFEYPSYNTITEKSLNTRIRPLIAMECTIIAKRYMGLGHGFEAENKFLELKDKCRKVKGCFTLLWHNSHFTNSEDKTLYERILQ